MPPLVLESMERVLDLAVPRSVVAPEEAHGLTPWLPCDAVVPPIVPGDNHRARVDRTDRPRYLVHGALQRVRFQPLHPPPPKDISAVVESRLRNEIESASREERLLDDSQVSRIYHPVSVHVGIRSADAHRSGRLGAKRVPLGAI